MVSNPAIAVPELGEHTAEVLAELSAGAFRRGRRRSGKPGPA
jgi:hypothetical protein